MRLRGSLGLVKPLAIPKPSWRKDRLGETVRTSGDGDVGFLGVANLVRRLRRRSESLEGRGLLDLFMIGSLMILL